MNQTINTHVVYLPQKLQNALENIKTYSLTVLEAPSGFGKTTALEAFFEQKDFAAVPVFKHTFFSDSLAEYWQWFCKTLSDIDPFNATALRGVQTPCADNMAFLHEMLSDVECPSEAYIVFDNLCAPESTIETLIIALSCNLQQQLQILLSVQAVGTGSNLAIAASGKAFFLDASDFAFSEKDCQAYFAAAGLILTPSETEELYAITGGWIFAVYLQLLFFAKNRRFEKGILNNLIEKAFFSRLTQTEKAFYLALTPLNSFTVRQAVDIGGCDTDFVHTHLCGGFIHYDSKKSVYYFHNLLHEYLREVFDCLDKPLKRRYYQTAAAWEEQFGEKINAIRLYYLAEDYERIFSMPHTSYDLSDIGDGNTRKMIFDILDKTPYEVKLRHCESMVPLAFILFCIGEIPKLVETIEEIRVLVEQSTLPEARKKAVLGETELLLSFTAFNDIAAMSRYHRKALELLAGKESFIHLRSTWTFGSPSIVCLYHRTPGSLQHETALMDECMPIYYTLTGGHGSGSEYAMRAEALYLCGAFDEAEKAAHRAVFEAQSKKQSSVVQSAKFVLAAITLAQGNAEKLFDTLISLSESASDNEEDMCRYTLDLIFSYIYAFSHRTDKVCAWLADGDITETRLAAMTIPFAQIVYAKVLLERKEYLKLLAYCPFARGRAEAGHTVLPQIYFYVFEACASTALGDRTAAEEALKKAFALSRDDKIVMPFAQCFSAIEPLLAAFPEDEMLRNIRRMGADFEKAMTQIGSGKAKLSPREAEVAELIRQGFTNKQIAARLYISLSTVKMTVSNIFEKTGVKSRAQLSDIFPNK